MNTNLVSIITPTYNSSKYIRKTLESVLAQTYDNWELLITDDVSSDDTCKIIEQYMAEDHRIKLFRLSENGGAGVARNNSLTNAKGRFIAFLDADDLWLPHKLERQIKFMVDKKIALSFTSYRQMTEEGVAYGKIVDSGSPVSVGYHDMLKKAATMGCLTVMLDTNALGTIKMPEIRTGQDYATWLHILKQGHTAYNLVENLANYRILQNSISRNKCKKAKRQWEIYRKIEGLSLSYSIWCFCWYAWRAISRR